MSKLHVYITPFADDEGTAYGDEIEVTDDVLDMGDLTEALDNTEYDIGVFRAANMKLSLYNGKGRYSAAGEIDSIFKHKRYRSKVRVTWEPGDGPLTLGHFLLGAPDAILSEEVTVFEGLLSDVGTKQDLEDVDVDFQVMGYDSLLQEMLVPFSELSNGDSLQEILFKCLNQAPLNEFVEVDNANIDVGSDEDSDDVSGLENKTVLAALKDLLLASNSVLYIRDGVLYTGPREAAAELGFTFYGPGATEGIENILPIKNYRTGENTVRNLWTWKDTALAAQDVSSRDDHGTQAKEIKLDLITDDTKRSNLLTALKDEFAFPKRQMELTTWIWPDNLVLYLLDRVKVDYPSVPIPNENQQTAQYNIPEGYNVDYYADELYPVTIEPTARFKILSRTLDFRNETVKFALREI